MDTKVSTLLTPVSLYFLVWRRPETGDRFEKGERQSVYSTVGEHSVLPFLDISAVLGYLTATHAVSSSQAQHKVNCPKGKRRSPGGYPCCATRWSGGYGRHLRIIFDVRFYRRVRQGELPVRAREGALGCDLGAPPVNSSAHAQSQGSAPAPPPTGCGQTILPLHDTFLFQNAKRYILPEKFMLY